MSCWRITLLVYLFKKSTWVLGIMRICLYNQVTVSDGNNQEGPLRVSEAAIQISRCRVIEYLSLHTGYDLLPDSGKVWKINCSYYGFIFNIHFFLDCFYCYFKFRLLLWTLICLWSNLSISCMNRYWMLSDMSLPVLYLW
jgi:hypothetical protein